MSMLSQTLNVYPQAFYGFESKLYLRRWVLYQHWDSNLPTIEISTTFRSQTYSRIFSMITSYYLRIVSFFQPCHNFSWTGQSSGLLQDHVELHGRDDQVLQRIRIRRRKRKRKLSHDQRTAKELIRRKTSN